ncbi:hypothetical protein HNP72_002227 [Sphingobacterium soli]|uniref:Uncharacterized protein n=1 Tax=Sphingobacterium cellulitidis TaxID=1768011 RepID=A0A8H9KT32_9SPHI|nr:hypothetical protein [Sphingobacterium soli]GGE16248.1 hypothetical protein GCM10011516_12470 [Sphingobacterium soli]
MRGKRDLKIDKFLSPLYFQLEKYRKTVSILSIELAVNIERIYAKIQERLRSILYFSGPTNLGADLCRKL